METAADRAASIEFLRSRARGVGLRPSRSQLAAIVDEVGSRDGRLAAEDWAKAVASRGSRESERLTLTEYLGRAHDLHLGQHLLRRTAKLGVAFFAASGAHAAGAAGMHGVGAVIVGGITALGGGTLNNLIAGSAPVGWAKDPSFLAVALAAAAAGFYAWPLVEDALAESGGISGGVPDGLPRYAAETVALGALSVVGAQQGVVAGFAPVVCCAMGVTVAFGGVARDVILGRPAALGSVSGCQSYGVASAAGAAVYVGLREVHVWNCAGSAAKLVHGGLPLSLRIAAGFGAVVAVRALAWQNKPAALLATMDESAAANRDRLAALGVRLRPPSAGPDA